MQQSKHAFKVCRVLTIIFIAPVILFGCTSAGTPGGPGPSLTQLPTKRVSDLPPTSIKPTGLPTRTPQPPSSTPTVTPTATPSATPSPSSHIPYQVNTIAVQADGRIVVAGWYTVARLQPDGSLDTTFDLEWDEAGHISAMAVQADGRILIGGRLWVSYPTLNTGGLTSFIRYNSDGSVDDTFQPALPGTGDGTALAVQADGKIVVGTGYKGDLVESPGLARLNPDGSLDTTFDVSAMAFDVVCAIALQADGRVLVNGSYNHGTGSMPDGVVRLTRSGALDTSFDSSASGSAPIVVQADDKILLGTRAGNGVLRANADGAPDTTFGPGPEPAVRVSTWAIAVQPDGKILVGGYFHSPKEPDEYFVRLHPDGMPDPTFKPPEALTHLTGDSQILAIAVQTDGKILVGGEFNTGVEQVYLIRLNHDGSLDATFKPNPGSWTLP